MICATAGGHRVVTTVIKQLGLDKYSVPFDKMTNPLFYLRTKNMYLNSITSDNPAPYHVDHYGADNSPDTGFNVVQAGQDASKLPQTRAAWWDSIRTAVSRSICRGFRFTAKASYSRTSDAGT